MSTGRAGGGAAAGSAAGRAFARWAHDRRGANMVEYVLLVGVVALISIMAFKFFQVNARKKVNEQAKTVTTINAGQGQ